MTASSSSRGQREHGADGQDHGSAPDAHGHGGDDFVGGSQDDFAADFDLFAESEEGALDLLRDHPLCVPPDLAEVPPSAERTKGEEEDAEEPDGIDPGQHAVGAHGEPVGGFFEAGGEGKFVQEWLDADGRGGYDGVGVAGEVGWVGCVDGLDFQGEGAEDDRGHEEQCGESDAVADL